MRGCKLSENGPSSHAGTASTGSSRNGVAVILSRFRDNTRQTFVLPNSLSNGLAVAHSIGAVLIMILASSVLGTEYGWGTLRAVLTRGVNRWQFLGAKALSLLLLGAGGFIIVALTVAVSSLIVASLLVDDGGLANSGQWSTVAMMFGKAVYGLLPYLVVALFLSVLTASSSMGIAFSLAYFFVESILVQILEGLFDWFSNVTDFLLGTSVTSWMTERGVRATGGEPCSPSMIRRVSCTPSSSSWGTSSFSARPPSGSSTART